MKTLIFSQKNVCAALGFLMALTIVWKAKVESSLAQQTARFEYTKPTTTAIGNASGAEMMFSDHKKNKAPESPFERKSEAQYS